MALSSLLYPWGTMGAPTRAANDAALAQLGQLGYTNQSGGDGAGGWMLKTDEGMRPAARDGDGNYSGQFADLLQQSQVDPNMVNLPGGKQWYRTGTGDPTQAFADKFASARPELKYHPEYGWGYDPTQLAKYGIGKESLGDKVLGAMPIILGSLMMGGAGALTAGAGGAGAGVAASGLVDAAAAPAVAGATGSTVGGAVGGLGSSVGLSAADLAGLTQMGQAAGLQGAVLDSFVGSGGTLGSTAAGLGGGGVIGMGNEGAWGANPTGGEVAPGTTPPGTPTPTPSFTDAMQKYISDMFTPEGLLKQGVSTGVSQLVQSGGDAATDAATNTATGTMADFMKNAGAGTTPQTITDLLNSPAAPSIKQIFDTAGGGAAGASALAQLLGIDDATAKLLGTALSTGLGVYGSNQQANSLAGIAAQSRADRMPALNAYNTALTHPDTFYNSAPAQGGLDAVLRKLSVQGNPALNPGALSKAAAYNLGGYDDYLKSLQGAAFGTAGNEMNVNVQGATAANGIPNSLGYGLAGLTSTDNGLSSLMSQLGNYLKLSNGSGLS